MESRTGSPALPIFTLDQLAALTDIFKRTIRYYIQIGLVPRPVGEGRAAHYLLDHLDRLLQIKRLSGAGVSLERIREILSGEPSPVPPRRLKPGHLDVKHHIHVAPGVQIVYSPDETSLDVKELREFASAMIDLAGSWGLEKAGEASEKPKSGRRRRKPQSLEFANAEVESHEVAIPGDASRGIAGPGFATAGFKSPRDANIGILNIEAANMGPAQKPAASRAALTKKAATKAATKPAAKPKKPPQKAPKPAAKAASKSLAKKPLKGNPKDNPKAED